MNLVRALDVALPEIPARTLAQRYPRLDPGATFKEHIEGGKPVVRVYIPSLDGMTTFPETEWKLVQLFDGNRSFEQIAELYSQDMGVAYDAEAVREFAAELDAADLWYKTQQEKNILLLQQTAEERRKKVQTRSRWADLSMVVFPAFNPDRFVTWAYNHTRFIYTTWFTLLSLLAMGIGAGINITHWKDIWRDTLQFYNFADKTWGDIFILYSLGMFIVALHEFAHAHACKRVGGRVPAMGFALVFLTPAFYTDTTEGSALGTRTERLVISLAGIWSELLLCAIATPIWWASAPDSLVHNGAYFIMMFTGIMSLIINWNPLMKLDGYHMMCEILGIPDIKENSTAYVSSWVKKHIWRLPVEVPYVPKRRRPGFAIYALLSGAYSYTVLYVVARFAGNIVRNFSPEWGFIPELAVAFIIFRPRIHTMVNFMNFVYLDKKDRTIAWFTPKHTLATVAIVTVLLALPVRHESVLGKCVLEPVSREIVRARVAGTVAQINVREGEQITPGEKLAVLRNLPLQSEFERTQTQFQVSADRAKAASLNYSGYGAALREKEQLGEQLKQAVQRNSELELASPISGTVVTPRVQDLTGSYLVEGSQVMEVADFSRLRARIYVSEYDLQKVRLGANTGVLVPGKWRMQAGKVEAISANVFEMDPELMDVSKLQGMTPPHFYLVDLIIENPGGELRPGMIGVGRIYGRRRSSWGLIWESVSQFFGRKLW